MSRQYSRLSALVFSVFFVGHLINACCETTHPTPGSSPRNSPEKRPSSPVSKYIQDFVKSAK